MEFFFGRPFGLVGGTGHPVCITCFFHFMRRFWYHVLTWSWVKPRARANSDLSGVWPEMSEKQLRGDWEAIERQLRGNCVNSPKGISESRSAFRDPWVAFRWKRFDCDDSSSVVTRVGRKAHNESRTVGHSLLWECLRWEKTSLRTKKRFFSSFSVLFSLLLSSIRKRFFWRLHWLSLLRVISAN